LNLGEQGVGLHGSSRLVDVFSLQGQGARSPPMGTVQKLTARRSRSHMPAARSRAAARRSAFACALYAIMTAGRLSTMRAPNPVTRVRVMPRPLPPADPHAMVALMPSAPRPRLPIALCWLCSAIGCLVWYAVILQGQATSADSMETVCNLTSTQS
jgi:hypothetical protein